MRSELFSAENREKESMQPGMRLQTPRVEDRAQRRGDGPGRFDGGYQGAVPFQALGSGGSGKFLKQKLNGEGVPLMKVSGRG